MGRCVVLLVHISSGHTSTNQRFGHLPQNTIALPGYLGLVKIFSKCCFSSFLGTILIIADCNQGGRSPTPPLLATVRTKPHLCLMMYLSSFCSNSQADGKAGQTDRREVNFSDSPLPPNPHLTCPNCLHRPSQFVKYGSHPFAKRERRIIHHSLPPSLMALV